MSAEPVPEGGGATLRDGLLDSAARFGDREALTVGDARRSYAELLDAAWRIAETLDAADDQGAEPRLTAVLGHRHPTAFEGIAAALLRGHGYVPLNPAFPVDRSRAMLARSGARALVVDPSGAAQLPALLEGLEPRTALLPDAEDVSALAAAAPGHRILGRPDLLEGRARALGGAGPDDVAYLLFTSGSTGQPKGVPVLHRNVTAFLDAVLARYAIDETDRLSNTFDLTFDLSVFDVFAAWARGACVCVPTAQQKMFPGKYVKKQGLTVWFSVPSTGVLMSRLKMLKPGAYPTLRWALFCGEALPVEVVERFAGAAPNARCENLYGPTELTIACAVYRWDPGTSPDEARQGVVPIGAPYPGMEARIVDEALQPVPPGEAGELLMTGPQTTPGYWRDHERTAKAFVRLEGDARVFYRTGDRVAWPEGEPMRYLGRVDQQVKIQGYRVELGEIEALLRELSGAEVAIALGWPRTASGADGVVAFVGAPGADAAALLDAARERLPGYMQPSAIHLVGDFPLNANGKVDRRALAARLEA